MSDPVSISELRKRFSPAWNHTRGDSPLYPCETCVSLLQLSSIFDLAEAAVEISAYGPYEGGRNDEHLTNYAKKVGHAWNLLDAAVARVKP